MKGWVKIGKVLSPYHWQYVLKQMQYLGIIEELWHYMWITGGIGEFWTVSVNYR